MLALFYWLQGDYYFYTALNAADPDRDKLHNNTAFGIPYKDWYSGPLAGQTNGTWAVESVTGPGHVSVLIATPAQHCHAAAARHHLHLLQCPTLLYYSNKVTPAVKRVFSSDEAACCHGVNES